jgi:hypothetical protein
MHREHRLIHKFDIIFPLAGTMLTTYAEKDFRGNLWLCGANYRVAIRAVEKF